MCCRYDNLIAREAYKGLYKTTRLPASNFPPRCNIAPTDQVPIVRVDPRDRTREFVMALMKAYEVSRAVNSVKNDTPDCIEPLA